MAGFADGLADDNDLPIFDVQRVQLQFSIAASFVAAQVANNVLVLALSNGRILRIDLNRPEDIDDIDLPRRPSEIGVIERMFLDPTASHLLVCTALGETYYLHSQSRTPRPLARLRGVAVTAVAWNPARPTASTREIVLGAADGHLYETYLETATEFYRKEDKYVKLLARVPDAQPVTGLWVDALPGRSDQHRRVLASTPTRLLHWVGKVGSAGRAQDGGGGGGGTGSIYSKLFDAEQPTTHEAGGGGSPATSPAASSSLVVSPDAETGQPYEEVRPDRAFAWLSPEGVYHGKLLVAPQTAALGGRVFGEAKLLPRAQLGAADAAAVGGIALTQWHVLSLVGGRVVAANRLTGAVVYDQAVLGDGGAEAADGGSGPAVALCVDVQKSTFWLFAAHAIFEVVVRDEDRDVWRVMLQLQQFDAALQYARTPAQRDAVATASGDYLLGQGLFAEAAGIYGKSSSKPLEEVALALIDRHQPDALRTYLLAKLGTYSKRTGAMQRTMVATWLVELFMARLNGLEDAIATRAEGADKTTATATATATATTTSAAASDEQLALAREEFQAFVRKHAADLDRRTVYDVISSHGREAELLFFADAVNDYDYVLSYWVQRGRWSAALAVLARQTEAEAFYRYGSGLMASPVAGELVDVLLRQGSRVEPRRMIPALLEYDGQRGAGAADGTTVVPLGQHQAVRYLQQVIRRGDAGAADAAVHNTLVALYAAHGTRDETALLAYLEAQGDEPRYDPDFALRLCIRHGRVLSCVHIYTSMGQYEQAVDLALAHGAVELAAVVADRPQGRANAGLRKRLWLAVARKVITGGGEAAKTAAAAAAGPVEEGPASAGSRGIKTALAFLKRCELLRIEDLIPFFPDFVVIDDFKEEICAALEDYSRAIEGLRKEMDDSSTTAANIQGDIAALDRRYAMVEPGEPCHACGLPLLSRQFFVFPCQHAFHSDCLGRRVLEQSGAAVGRRIRELQAQLGRGVAAGAAKDALVAELDALVASSCILCSDLAIKKIDEPFVRADEDQTAWAV